MGNIDEYNYQLKESNNNRHHYSASQTPSNYHSQKKHNSKHHSGNKRNNAFPGTLKRPKSATLHKTDKTKTNEMSNSNKWFNRQSSTPCSPTTPFSLSSSSINGSSTKHSSISYGYIQSLPTSQDNGWIYHPQYGMILFTYNEALETVRNSKKTRKYSTSYSEISSSISNNNNKTNSDDSKHNHLSLTSKDSNNSNNGHLELPSQYARYSRSPSRSYKKYGDRNSRSPSPNIMPYSASTSPSPSPGPPCLTEHDKGLSDINRLYIYQPVKFELTNDDREYIGSPICNIDDEQQIEIEENLCSIDDEYSPKQNGHHHNHYSKSANKRRKSRKSRNRSKGRKIFNDDDDTDRENDDNVLEIPIDAPSSFNGYISQRRSRRSQHAREKHDEKMANILAENKSFSNQRQVQKHRKKDKSKKSQAQSNLRAQLQAAKAIKKQVQLLGPPDSFDSLPSDTLSSKPTKPLGPRPDKPPPTPPPKKNNGHKSPSSVSQLSVIGISESLNQSSIKSNHLYYDSLSSSAQSMTAQSIGSMYSIGSNITDKSSIDISDASLSSHKSHKSKKKTKRLTPRKHKKAKVGALRLEIPDESSMKQKSKKSERKYDSPPPSTTLSPRSLALAPSITVALAPSAVTPSRYGKGRTRSRQKVAHNVKLVNTVQNDDMSLYVFSPKGRHYEKMQVEQVIDVTKAEDNDDIVLHLPNMGIIKDGVENNGKSKKQKKKKRKHTKKHKDQDEEEIVPYVNYTRQRSIARGSTETGDGIKENKRRSHQRGKSYKNVLKLPKFGKLRRKSHSDEVNSGNNKKKNKVAFCPSNSQYYIQHACLLHYEGKSIDGIQQNGVKKCVTKNLFDEESDNNNNKSMDNIYFSMKNDMESLCDELEEKINRLFNNNGGTIYVGITDKSCNKQENDDIDEYMHGHNNSNSFTKKSDDSNNNDDDNKEENNRKKSSNSPRESVQNHIIYGIKLNSKMRYSLKSTITDEILGGFEPQIPHLMNNFALKFVPVVSQNGQIIPRHFVIKMTIVAPILGMNGEKLQFRTKDGFAHVLEF